MDWRMVKSVDRFPNQKCSWIAKNEEGAYPPRHTLMNVIIPIYIIVTFTYTNLYHCYFYR